MEALIYHIKEYMFLNEMTQKDLAKELKTSQSYISNLLSGQQKDIRLSRLYEIADLFDCTVGELLRG